MPETPVRIIPYKLIETSPDFPTSVGEAIGAVLREAGDLLSAAPWRGAVQAISR
jgi:hypothetical protein